MVRPDLSDGQAAEGARPISARPLTSLSGSLAGVSHAPLCAGDPGVPDIIYSPSGPSTFPRLSVFLNPPQRPPSYPISHLPPCCHQQESIKPPTLHPPSFLTLYLERGGVSNRKGCYDNGKLCVFCMERRIGDQQGRAMERAPRNLPPLSTAYPPPHPPPPIGRRRPAYPPRNRRR